MADMTDVADGANAGFTLIELLVVMALLALAFVFVPPMLSGSISTAELTAAARNVAAGLRGARGEAIAGNREVSFVLDVEERSYRVGGRSRGFDPGREIVVALLTARSERLDDTVGAIRFFPDGSSTGGGVTLAGAGREYRVLVDWLTGRVSIAQ